MPTDSPSHGQGRAPAKLILSGEHAVVYGHLAVAVAVDRWTHVALVPSPGPTSVAPGMIPVDDRLEAAVRAVLPATGLSVHISGNVPVGRGMGSSASLAIAMVRAEANLRGETAGFAHCYAQGFLFERVFHGNPSGVDHTVVARGGAIQYRKTGDQASILPQECPVLPLVVFDTGVAGNTAQMVSMVASRRPAVDGVLSQMGALTEQFAHGLSTGCTLDALGAMMSENHRLLQRLGVSTPALDALVSFACRAGAFGAKLAGAGGGGVVVALAPDPQALAEAARRNGYSAFSTEVVPAREESI